MKVINEFVHISRISMFPDLEGQTWDENRRALVMNNVVGLAAAEMSLFYVSIFIIAFPKWIFNCYVSV